MRQRPWKGLWALLSLLLLTTQCTALSARNSLEPDLAQLQRDLNTLKLSVQSALEDAEEVMSQFDRRIRNQHAETRRTLTAFSSRVQALESELRSRIDALNNDLAGLTSRVMELSRRLEKLSDEMRSAPPRAAPETLPSLKPSPSRRP